MARTKVLVRLPREVPEVEYEAMRPIHGVRITRRANDAKTVLRLSVDAATVVEAVSCARLTMYRNGFPEAEFSL